MPLTREELLERLTDLTRQAAELPASLNSDSEVLQEFHERLSTLEYDLAVTTYTPIDPDELVIREVMGRVLLKGSSYGLLFERQEERINRLSHLIATNAPSVIVENELRVIRKNFDIIEDKYREEVNG